MGINHVGRALRNSERWRTDEEYRNKHKEIRDKYYQKNKERISQYRREYNLGLNQWANKHCKKCKKLLNHKTKGKYCRICRWLK